MTFFLTQNILKGPGPLWLDDQGVVTRTDAYKDSIVLALSRLSTQNFFS